MMASLAQSCSMTSVEYVEGTIPVVQRLLEPSIKKGNMIAAPQHSCDLNKVFRLLRSWYRRFTLPHQLFVGED